MGPLSCLLRPVEQKVLISKMFRNAFQKLTPVGTMVAQQAKRNIGVSSVVYNQVDLDPIQKLFLDKVREYKTKSAGGKLVDASPQTEATFKDMMANLERAFGAKGKDMTAFPTFAFQDPDLVYPGLDGAQKDKLEAAAKAAEEAQAKADAEPGEFDDWDPLMD